MNNPWQCPGCNTWYASWVNKCECSKHGTVTVTTPFMQEYGKTHTLTTCPKCNMIIDADLPHDCEEAKPYGVRMPPNHRKDVCYVCGTAHPPGMSCPDVAVT